MSCCAGDAGWLADGATSGFGISGISPCLSLSWGEAPCAGDAVTDGITIPGVWVWLGAVGLLAGLGAFGARAVDVRLALRFGFRFALAFGFGLGLLIPGML